MGSVQKEEKDFTIKKVTLGGVRLDDYLQKFDYSWLVRKVKNSINLDRFHL